MNSFSDLYVNSQMTQELLKGVPESDRENFINLLRQSISQYDAFFAVGGGNPEMLEILKGSSSEIPKEEGRRPPRRR